MTWYSFDDWVADAKRTDLLGLAERYGAKLRKSGSELVGPCPACGGEDRFAINPRKQVWNCGHHGGAGGDAIALAGHVLDLKPGDARDFVRICEAITGAPPPERDRAESPEERAEREARMVERARTAEDNARRREMEAQEYRDAEIRRALDIWESRRPIIGTHAEAYLAARGIRHVAGLRLGFVERLGFFVKPEMAKGFLKVADLPAMVAGIADQQGRFTGVHITYLDPAEPKKATVVHPDTGLVEPAKKIRGSVHGGVLRLAGPVAEPRRFVCGEGIETTLYVRDEMIDAGRDIADVAWWAGISLGNIGGKATESVRHPAGLTKTDKAGRQRAVMIPGPVPAPDSEGIALPASVTEALLLGDGDSDPATTDFALRRCAARWARPGLTVRRAWARDGQDFNDMRRAS